jgi:hypothetical protein
MEPEHFELAMFMDTKAAVLAAQESFEAAVETQLQAIARLDGASSEEIRDEFQRHLEAYQKGLVWHE